MEKIDKLEIGEKEVYLGDLPNEDKFQVLVRHLNLMNGYLSMIADNQAIQSICLIEMAEKQGINIRQKIDKGE